ncbi:IPP transferase-domain-containing protein [Umbelopsis sp. AD052]|nr:IPP transferase-domain-containing protein [Umbelopsis sp. AD052]
MRSLQRVQQWIQRLAMFQPTRSTIAVIGTTGVGKSQLGIELSKALHGEVINADSMQVTESERENVPHHLMDFLEPEDEYLVTQFVKDASDKIEEISDRKSLPVLVGGTNYYVQSLLWPMSLISTANDGSSSSDEQEEEDGISAMDTQALYQELQKVDPIMAAKWHPGDRRKIAKSLKVYRDTGRPQSEIIKEQQERAKTDVNLRYNTIIFWLYTDPVTLNKRLDDRVMKMIELGLFDELSSLRKRVQEGTLDMPGKDLEKYQRGIWQAIGYKEFDEYLTAVENGNLGDKELLALREESVERMKAATRRYAKRQVQWIRNKLLPTIWNTQDTLANLKSSLLSITPSQSIQLYLLDATDLSQWDENVKNTAVKIAQDFVNDKDMPDPTTLNEFSSELLTREGDADPRQKLLNWKKHTCEVCTNQSANPVVLNGDLELKQHISSRLHRRNTKREKMMKKKMDQPE